MSWKSTEVLWGGGGGGGGLNAVGPGSKALDPGNVGSTLSRWSLSGK